VSKSKPHVITPGSDRPVRGAGKKPVGWWWSAEQLEALAKSGLVRCTCGLIVHEDRAGQPHGGTRGLTNRPTADELFRALHSGRRGRPHPALPG
jgi:hypothetical protein